MTDWGAIGAIAAVLVVLGALVGWRSGKRRARRWQIICAISWLLSFIWIGNYEPIGDEARFDLAAIWAVLIFTTSAAVVALIAGAVVARRAQRSE